MHVWAGAHGNRLRGDSWGASSAPLVVLLHGGGQTRHSWRRTARHFADAGFHAVAYDARGHGDSDWVPGSDYGDMAMAQDLACVLRAIGAASPVLIGASMGGITSMVALGNRMVEASALILADVAHVSADSGVDRVLSFMAGHAQGFGSLQEAGAAVSAYRGGGAGGRRDGTGLARNLR